MARDYEVSEHFNSYFSQVSKLPDDDVDHFKTSKVSPMSIALGSAVESDVIETITPFL